MSEDRVIERALLISLLGEPANPNEYGGFVWLGWGEMIGTYCNAIAIIPPECGPFTITGSSVDIASKGTPGVNGWLLFCEGPVWPPTSFEQLIANLSDPEFRRRHRIDRLLGRPQPEPIP